MQHVRANGYPAPEVVEVAGGDIVMERVEGPTMLTALSQRPWRMPAYAKTLAGLLARLHELPPPAWLMPRLGDGDTFVHLDLHPDNVILTAHGPVVIDWTNAGRGNPDAEIADLWLIMANAEIPGSRIKTAVLRAGRRIFVRRFIGRFDRDAVRRQLRVALEHRLRDRNMGPAERERMTQFVERVAL
jgi:aminoglycoside phosphotransferase (APT) family kinase protein